MFICQENSQQLVLEHEAGAASATRVTVGVDGHEGGGRAALLVAFTSKAGDLAAIADLNLKKNATRTPGDDTTWKPSRYRPAPDTKRMSSDNPHSWDTLLTHSLTPQDTPADKTPTQRDIARMTRGESQTRDERGVSGTL